MGLNITTPFASKQFQEGFLAGTPAVFMFTFSDIAGDLFDPSDIDIIITEPDGTEAKTADSIDRVYLGEYAFRWDIPTTATIGAYTIEVIFVTETSSGPSTSSFSEKFIVGEVEGDSIWNVNRTNMRRFLELLISQTQKIPMFNEIGRLNKARTIAKFSFPRWNQVAGVDVYLGGSPKETGFTVDYVKGRIEFDNPLSFYDEVTADFNFRWFSDGELDEFLEQGINMVNIWPPVTSYSIVNIHTAAIWGIAAEYSAAVNVLRAWMMNIQFQEPAKIFGGLERRNEVFQHLNELKKNYEEDLYKMLEQKKYGPYEGLTKTYTTPEFTLPGGRSRWFRYLFKGG